MKTMKINQQKAADQNWKDETGIQIPYNRITSYERKSERTIAQISREAVKLNELLTKFKAGVKASTLELYEAFLADNGGRVPGKGKGGATFYNFDRSIKVEVSVNEAITFDDNLIALAKAKLDELLIDSLTDTKAVDIKPMIMDAFSTTRGRLDTKRVLGLRKHANRIKDERYGEAMQLIDKAIRRPESKEYFRVWIKKEDGEFQDVNLNFSSIRSNE